MAISLTSFDDIFASVSSFTSKKKEKIANFHIPFKQHFLRKNRKYKDSSARNNLPHSLADFSHSQGDFFDTCLFSFFGFSNEDSASQ